MTRAEFAARHRAPIWCGGFGCRQSNPDGSGLRWVQEDGRHVTQPPLAEAIRQLLRSGP